MLLVSKSTNRKWSSDEQQPTGQHPQQHDALAGVAARQQDAHRAWRQVGARAAYVLAERLVV